MSVAKFEMGLVEEDEYSHFLVKESAAMSVNKDIKRLIRCTFCSVCFEVNSRICEKMFFYISGYLENYFNFKYQHDERF